jgi:peptide/nickel transport system substrate-binding protein
MSEKWLKLALALALAVPGLGLAIPAAQAQTLRIGLAEDPDVLDPHLARTFVGRIVFAALCDKLIDIDDKLGFVPQLATSWTFDADGKAVTFKLRPNVQFHDGAAFDANVVKLNIERAQTHARSFRKAEIAAVDRVEVVDPLTARFVLKEPFAPLMAQLSDRAGMMISPQAIEQDAKQAGAIGQKPVCAGPFKFVERVQQDRIVVEKFDGYWNKDQIHFQRVTYLPIPDSTIRLANLQSGQLDLIERTSPNDLAAVRKDAKLKVTAITGLGYQGITINIANGEKSKNPLGQDRRIREALELSIDRAALNQVVFNGEHEVGNQAVPPNSPYYVKKFPVPKRDVARAKALLKEAGHTSFAFEMMVPNDTQMTSQAQVIQAMAREAGFDIKLVSTEFATALQKQTQGDYVAFQIGWSGRSDPDGNINVFILCGAPLNEGKYCDPEADKALNEARRTADVAARQKAFEKAAEIYMPAVQRIYLYHQRWHYSHSAKLANFAPVPDGLIRLQGLKLQ